LAPVNKVLLQLTNCRRLCEQGMQHAGENKSLTYALSKRRESGDIWETKGVIG
jgi:hypothetical protein